MIGREERTLQIFLIISKGLCLTTVTDATQSSGLSKLFSCIVLKFFNEYLWHRGYNTGLLPYCINYLTPVIGPVSSFGC